MTSNCLEKCGICYEEKNLNHFKILECNHKVCKQCFPRIKNPLCPFCRQPFISNRRRSLPISIPNSNNELDDIQNIFGNLIVNRQRLSYDNHLENALRLQQRQERRQERRIRRRNRRNIQGIERGITIGPSQVFDFVENVEEENVEEENVEENVEENHKIEYRDNRRRNNRSNRWQQLNNQRHFMSRSL